MDDFYDITPMVELIKKLNKATEEYDKGNPIMSDKEWDQLYFELKQLEDKVGFSLPDSPTKNVIFTVVDKLPKVKHNHKMLSLAKTKDWNEFIRYFNNKDVIGMVKLDGLTCSLEYKNGCLIRAETRGNGEIGEDILHNARIIPSIPNYISYKDNLIVDGEIICSYQDFEAVSQYYANPRNFASGSIRLLDSNECYNRHLTFVVWNVIKGFDEENSFLTKLLEVKKLGFEIVPYTSGFDWDAKDFLVDTAKELGYPIDGLVGRFDDIQYGESLGETNHHSKAAFAFKFYDDSYETKLKEIEWTLGRTGILTPVAIFEPVEIDGTIVERASLHNLSIMKNILHSKSGWKNQTVNVIKSNQIIPQIESAQEDDKYTKLYFDYPHVCPICGGLTKIDGDNLICSNPLCSGKLINKLDHFCGKQGLDIKGLSKATLEKLIEWNWIEDFSDLFQLNKYAKEWYKKPGFGEKSVDNILEAINNSKNTNLSSFISAIGIPLIGKVLADKLAYHVKTYEGFREKIDNHFDFSQYEGFADSKTYEILNFDYSEADKVYQFLNLKPAEEKKNINKNLSNFTICITGKLNIFHNRDELIQVISSQGGKVVNKMSKNVNILINNDINSESAKNQYAKANNITILSEKDFKEKYLDL